MAIIQTNTGIITCTLEELRERLARLTELRIQILEIKQC